MRRYDAALALLLVVTAHTGALVGVLWTRSPQPPLITMPTVQGVLVPAPPAEQIKAPPAPAPPKPLRVEQPKPPPKPRPEPKPQPKPAPKPLPPVPEGPPSAQAVSAPPSTPPSAAAPPALSGNDEALAAPVMPPRVDASQLKNPAPVYPMMSRRLREQGTVYLELLIEPDGTIGDIRVKTSSGSPRLDASALAAVRRWRYLPATRGGVAIAFRYVQPIEFFLNR